MGCNPCRPPATYVNVGCGNQQRESDQAADGHHGQRVGPGLEASKACPRYTCLEPTARGAFANHQHFVFHAATLELVKADVAQGGQLKIGGTPTFFMNGIQLPGLRPEFFDAAVAWELRRVSGGK